MNVSTTSALSVAAGAALADIPEMERAAALAAMVLLVGALQLLAGLFRLGFIVHFVSNAVMTGFLNGIAVLIILGQLGDLTGFQSRFSNNVARALDLALRLDQVHLPTTLIGFSALGVIVLLLQTRWRKFAFILAISVATVLLTVLSLPMFGVMMDWQAVRTVGDIAAIPRNLPELALPAPQRTERLLHWETAPHARTCHAQEDHFVPLFAALGAAELGGPPVDATGGRVGRHELAHAEPDDEDEDGDERPADRDGDRAAVVPRLAEGREAAREDRDDREGDREVGEARPRSVELLLVAELGEQAFVVREVHISHCLLYTSDAADERSSVDLGGRRIIKKKNKIYNRRHAVYKR